MNKHLDSYSKIIAITLYLVILFLCTIGTFFIPFDPYHYNLELKNLSPSRNYLKFPKHINASSIETIASSTGYSIALLKDHTIAHWGNLPTKLYNIPSNIVQIACGYEQIFLLDKDSNLHIYYKDQIQTIPLKKPVMKIYANQDFFCILYMDHTIDISSTNTYYKDLKTLQGNIKDLSYHNGMLGILTKENYLKLYGNESHPLHSVPAIIQNETFVLEELHLSNDYAVVKTATHEAIVWGNYNDAIYKNVIDVDSSSQNVFLLDELNHVITYGNTQYFTKAVPNRKLTAIYTDAYQMYGMYEDTVVSWGFSGFFFGSDHMGRCILTRLLHGGALTLWLPILLVILECILAILFGLNAGYWGGKVDLVLMNVCTTIGAIPCFTILLTIGFYFNHKISDYSLLFLSFFIYVLCKFPHFARYIRSFISDEMKKDYILASRSLGASHTRILWHHLLPPLKHIISHQMILSYADIILLETTLSIFGLGLQPPTPTWGNMLEQIQFHDFMNHNWWQWLFPFLAISCILMCLITLTMDNLEE